MALLREMRRNKMYLYICFIIPSYIVHVHQNILFWANESTDHIANMSKLLLVAINKLEQNL